MSTGNIRGLIQALPQFREVLGRLSVHISVSSELKNALNARSLTDLGELEQNLIYGDANSQDLIKFLSGERVAGVSAVCLQLLSACKSAAGKQRHEHDVNSQHRFKVLVW
eukprot:GHRQ01032372.1.p2 GENE.GHRQ01032372.1~~GHRQ01032372.1.p2  ORF type:complete len:110 (+),score=23.61 GHRQ01032372.1:302-631(+)